MEIEVYDTYATSEKGIKIHFDVMLPIGGNVGNASSYAQDFIKRIAESTDSIKLDSCNFVTLKKKRLMFLRRLKKMAIVLYQSELVQTLISDES